MDDNIRERMRRSLDANKENIQNIREALQGVTQSGEATKYLVQAEFSIISAIHEIKWMGSKEENNKEENGKDKNEEEILSHTDEVSFGEIT
jgi:hypothetical protein